MTELRTVHTQAGCEIFLGDAQRHPSRLHGGAKSQLVLGSAHPLSFGFAVLLVYSTYGSILGNDGPSPPPRGVAPLTDLGR